MSSLASNLSRVLATAAVTTAALAGCASGRCGAACRTTVTCAGKRCSACAAKKCAACKAKKCAACAAKR